MRNTNALCVCGLGLIVLAAVAGPAFGAQTFASGSVETINVGPDPWNEFIPGSSTSGLFLSSSGHTMSAQLLAAGDANGWMIFSSASATATDQFLAPSALGAGQLTITDRVTATFECATCAYLEGDGVVYSPAFSVEGDLSVNAIGAGTFAWNDAFYNVIIAGQYVATGLEHLNSDTGYVFTMPRGIVPSVSVAAQPGVSVELRIELGADSGVFTEGDSGSGTASADFGHTFRWVGVTDVINARTGEPLPVEFFHLYGEDGFDWAHPATVPEPSAVVLVVTVAAFFFRRRGRSRYTL